MLLLALLIYLVIVALIVGLVLYIVSILPVDPAIKNFVRIAVLVICAIVLIVFLLDVLGAVHLGGGPTLNIR